MLKEYKIPAGVFKISALNTYVDIENDVDKTFKKQRGKEFEIMFEVYKMN